MMSCARRQLANKMTNAIPGRPIFSFRYTGDAATLLALKNFELRLAEGQSAPNGPFYCSNRLPEIGQLDLSPLSLPIDLPLKRRGIRHICDVEANLRYVRAEISSVSNAGGH